MRCATPLLTALSLALSAGPARVHEGCRPAKREKLPKPSAETLAAFGAHGYRVGEDLTITHEASGAKISLPLQREACLDFSAEGAWVHIHVAAEDKPVAAGELPEILRGLRLFGQAAETDSKEAGRFIAEKGVPPVYNGLHLLNPDGSATYFGLMFYQGMKDKKVAPSASRLAQALDLFEAAHKQGFREKSPATAAKDLDRAFTLLAGPLLPGDSALPLRPYPRPDESVAAYRAGLADAAPGAAGFDEATRRRLQDGLATLNALERTRYHANLSLPKVPPPAAKDKEDKKPDDKKPDDEQPPHTDVLQRELPPLLSLLERFYGPLSSAQQESLVKSFPMGELVWRLRAHDLWKAGLTGKGVRACVFDTGVSPAHPELRGRVSGRFNALDPEGPPKAGDHATHVAGIIAALAPDALLYSYRVIRDGGENARLDPSAERYIASYGRAIDQGLSDGCHVMNMSFRSNTARDTLASKIREAVAAGVIVVVAAANEGAGGLEAPSTTPEAWSVGSLTHDDRMWVTSSHGATMDLRNGHRVKVLYMLPGHMINSTTAPSRDEPAPYARWSGTSMASPGLSAVVSLLLQSVGGVSDAINPLRADNGRLIREALEASARPIPPRELPPTAPPDQPFLIVNPYAAYERLSSGGLARR